MSGAALTAGRRGTAVLVDAPTATLDAGASVAGGRVLVLDADATRRFDPGTVDAMVLRCDGETILLFVWRERFDWGGSIRSNCPGSIGPLDTATLARRPIEPFRAGKVRIFWRERFDSMFLEHKSFAYGQAPLSRGLAVRWADVSSPRQVEAPVLK